MHVFVAAAEEVDGKTLIHLANHGSVEELKASGFNTIKTQVNLKMLLCQKTISKEEPVAAVFCHQHKPRKLTRDEIKGLEEGDRKLYLFRWACTYRTI